MAKAKTVADLNLTSVVGGTATVSTSGTRAGWRATLTAWTLTWGDGQSETGAGTPSPSSRSHAYAAIGTYSATLTVTDSTGVTVRASRAVAIGTATRATLTVVSGSGDGTYAAGQQVTIVADAPSAGQVFSAWTGGLVADPSNPTTTVVMPVTDLTLTATFAIFPGPAPPTPPDYLLTVVNGSGSGTYPATTVVTIAAYPPQAGQTFSAWTGATVADAASATTTLTLPASQTTVTATYVNLPPPSGVFTLTVVSGTGDGAYAAGATVPIVADAAPSGQVFSQWIGAGVVSPPVASGSVIMPAADTTVTATYRSLSSTPTSDPLVQVGNLTYLGAFRLPSGAFGNVPSDESSSFGWASAYGLAFDPAGNTGAGSLFLSSKENLLNVAEISIPALLTGPIAGLNTASVLQNMTDPSEGLFGALGVNRIGGLHVVGTSLVFDGYIFYDANNTQVLTHFTRSRTLATPSVQGPFATSYARPGFQPGQGVGGFLNGYMGAIPSAWQAAFGGTAFTGNGSLSIISRTSSGPGVFAFTPESLAASFPAQPLVYYPLEHETLGAGDASVGAGAVWKLADTIKGVAMPVGFRSVLFAGVHGDGVNGYGCGVSDPTLNGVYNCNTGSGVACGDYCWYDPVQGAKGQHAYPYRHALWAYDANDLAAVTAGTKQFYEPVPYAVLTLSLPYSVNFELGGMAYDPTTKRLYVLERGIDQASTYTFLPIIHAIHVS